MATDDQKARKERADSLHRKIDRIKQEQRAPADSTKAADESPNEFVQRRMRELGGTTGAAPPPEKKRD